MLPVTNLDEAKRLVDSFPGKPEEFVLSLSEELLDPFGMNMAIITDRVLARGWAPNGFDQKQGFRVYLYKMLK